MSRFRGPEEMPSRPRRKPVSARVSESTLQILKATAKKHKLPLAILVENILNDYALWLIERRSPNR